MFELNQTNTKQQGDEGLLVKFFSKSVFMRAQSEEEQRPIYKSFDYITIIQPGSGKELITRKATEQDKLRFDKQWERYSENKDQDLDGVPIENLPLIQPEEIATCKHLKIHTIEHLANVVDSNIGKLGLNGRILVNKAKNYLKNLGDKNEQKMEKYENLIEELSKKIKDLEENAPKKRGRRKKGLEDESIDDNTESSTSDAPV